MDRYIGIDAHAKSCTLSVQDAKGRELNHVAMETNGALLRDYIRTIPKARHIALEEGALSAWLYELLEPEAQEIVVFIPPKSHGQKNDLIDARRAAEKIRTHSFERVVFKPDRELAALRNALRAYQDLRTDLTRAMLRLNAVFRSRAVIVGSEIYSAKKRGPALAKLPGPEAQRATMMGEEVDRLGELLSRQTAVLRAEAKRCAAVKLLMTAPAIGLIRAATIVSVVGTPDRFRTRQQFMSYCGLAIVHRSSGRTVAVSSAPTSPLPMGSTAIETRT